MVWIYVPCEFMFPLQGIYFNYSMNDLFVSLLLFQDKLFDLLHDKVPTINQETGIGGQEPIETEEFQVRQSFTAKEETTGKG